MIPISVPTFEISSLIPLHVGKTINAACADGLAVLIQTGSYPKLEKAHHGQLLTLDAETGRVLGKLDGIGSARQIVLRDHIAYITSREDGVFIVSLADPVRPRLLCRYDTCEFATGICVAGDLMAVSLRQYGVELVNIADPENPRFLSLIRTGEAQSVWIDGHWVYAGVWGSRELVIADIGDPLDPQIACRAQLDGRGDGVTVRSGICFAATGQHARPPEGIEDPPPESYEKLGNGLEIFDVHDPAHPVHLSTVKFPPYYGLTFDMWSVRLSGNMAIVSNTRNGLFFVDISDLTAPKVIHRIQLPVLDDGTNDPIGGFDFSGNRVFLAGAQTDAYTVQLSRTLQPEICAVCSVSVPDKTWKLKAEFTYGAGIPWRRTLEGMHVHAVADAGDRLFAACSEAGVVLLRKSDFGWEAQIPCEGNAKAVAWRAPYLYVAEDLAGLAVYEKTGDTFACVSRYSPDGRAVSDLQFSGDGQYLMLQCASVGVIAMNITDPGRPKYMDSHLSFIGLFYGRHFPSAGYGNACYFSVNRDGLFEVKMEKDHSVLRQLPVPAEITRVAADAGLEVCGERLLVNSGGRYFWVPLSGNRENLTAREVDADIPYRGKPRISGRLLVTADRAEGIITFLDSSEPDHLRPVSQLRTTASPDMPVIDRNRVYIPGGRQGLLVFDRPF